MSLPTRNNPYNYEEFLKVRDGFDYYADDAFFQKVVKHYAGDLWTEIDQQARRVSKQASKRWRTLTEHAARPEEQPYILHYDSYNRRIDRIVRPQDTLIMEKEVFAERLFADGVSPWLKLAKMFIIYQNGEASVSCPLTCTEGMVEILKKYCTDETPELKNILKHLQEGINGEVAIGAQYISEIQGGSDIPNNVLEAVNEDGVWKLYGKKFWCSATHADYSMVTAKPQGSEEVGLFCMPSWLPGNKEKEIRNGYKIDRIKWKLGTSELTTAEIEFDGAVAYQVGPLNRGVANIVGIVLTLSRLTVGLSCAAYMWRSVREARQYAELREAFGEIITNFGLVEGQLQEIEQRTKATIAGAYKMYDDFIGIGLSGGISKDSDMAKRRKSFRVRELVMWQKITAAYDCTDVIRVAMSIFGGYGAVEDFHSLPRLYRDAVVNELWEGPRNVLLDQIFRDFQKATSWYPPQDFAADCLVGLEPALVQKFGAEMAELLAYPSLTGKDQNTIAICKQWDKFCGDFFHAYQDLALQEVEK